MVRMIVIAAVTWLLALPASACGVMEKAEPKVGSTVASADHVTLFFSQAFVPGESNVRIVAGDGSEVKADKSVSSNNDTALSLKLSPLAPAKYKVSWDVLWLDCQARTQGDYKFTVQ